MFQKNTKNGISSKLETGLYIRALIPEVVIIAITAVAFPVALPALATVAEYLLVIGGVGQVASNCGI